MERINIPGHKIAGFFNQYLAAVNWVRKNKSAPREEKLNRLLFPLVKFRKIAALPPGKEIPHRFFNGTFPFTSANRIKSTDLDLDNLHYDQKRYFIDWEVDNITRRRGPGIWLCETKEEKELRARMRREEEKRRGFPLEDEFIHCQYPGDLYENWLPSLDQARIQSRDLLDQILVCHTIKRALNGQEKAIAKLYGLYVDAAEATAVRFAKISKLIGKPSASSEGKKRIEKGISRGYLKEIKNDAKELLRFLICGFSPEAIVKQLIIGNGAGDLKSLPAWVKDFFIYYFSRYIPSRIQKNLEETRKIEKLLLLGMEENDEIQGVKLENRYIWLFFEWQSLMNPYAPIRDTFLWKNSPVRIRRFNNYSFQPGLVKMGPRRNLTTWLFGSKARPYGKLYQLLRDKYKPLTKRMKKERTFDFRNDLGENEKGLSIKDRKKALGFEGPGEKDENMIDRIDLANLLERIKGELVKLGISPRDIEIYIQWKCDKLTQSKIAAQHNLSSRQIKRICRKAKNIIPAIRPNIWSFISEL